MFAGGLAAALMEEAATWLVHGGALAFELATDSYFLLSRTFVTFSSTLLSFMRAHVVSLAWGLVVGAAVIDWVVVVVVVVHNLVAMWWLLMLSPLLPLQDLELGAVVEMMDICMKKLILLLMGRMAMIMRMALMMNLNLIRALPETKKLLRRNGPRSPRNAARIASASIPPLTLIRHLHLLRLPLLPLLPLLLTLIPTLTLPITARTRARRSSK
jgi:hypothetical protein